MSDPSYGFLSVLRRGLAALIQPSAPSADPRISVPVSLSVGGSPVATPPLALRGPGDVAGFDPGAIRRTWPAPDAANAEPNYFALLELSNADPPVATVQALEAVDGHAGLFSVMSMTSASGSALPLSAEWSRKSMSLWSFMAVTAQAEPPQRGSGRAPRGSPDQVGHRGPPPGARRLTLRRSAEPHGSA